jgi:hypothetical protein
VKLAEDARGLLRGRFESLARYALIPNWDQLGQEDQTKQLAELKKRVNRKPSRLDRFFETLNWERPYWARLDVPFRRLMADLADAWAGDEEHIPMREWATAVRDAARDAFEGATRSLETSARGLRAAAEARGQFEADLSKLVGRYIQDKNRGEEETV